MDELSDQDSGDGCYHPVGSREYDAELEPGRYSSDEELHWKVKCGECGDVVAEGWDPV